MRNDKLSQYGTWRLREYRLRGYWIRSWKAEFKLKL